jgi:Ser/Thr protein kinase RdoA (MazF antagonist)
MSREVTLVLTDGIDVFGRLPPFHVPTPWWADIAVVIEACRELLGRDVTILRLLETSTPSSAMGGRVTYLAEIDHAPATRLSAWTGPEPLSPQPHRAWWAEPGGVADALSWAAATLADRGVEFRAAYQQRTWNLSVLIRLDTTDGLMWLKAVPQFLADEGLVLRHLSMLRATRGMLPTVLGHDPSRRMVVLANVPGADLWESTASDVLALGERLLGLHRDSVLAGLPDLLANSVADRTTEAAVAGLAELARHGLPDRELPSDLRIDVERLRDELPDLLAPLAELPNVIVHGDPHPGNWRGRPTGERTLLDWGDASIGNPMIDLGALTARLPALDAVAVLHSLARSAADTFGSADLSAAVRALPLFRAVSAAVLYADFCRAIEPNEQVYHRDDVTSCLRDAVEVLDGGDV